eukprot:354043-Chlamydomonas_euryale.AAC.6
MTAADSFASTNAMRWRRPFTCVRADDTMLTAAQGLSHAEQKLLIHHTRLHAHHATPIPQRQTTFLNAPT